MDTHFTKNTISDSLSPFISSYHERTLTGTIFQYRLFLYYVQGAVEFSTGELDFYPYHFPTMFFHYTSICPICLEDNISFV